MKVSAVSQVAQDSNPRRNLFIRFSNSFMSVPENESPYARANAANPANPTNPDTDKTEKLGIENLQEFTIFPKEVIDGKTVITA